jgi:hypothetical protein
VCFWNPAPYPFPKPPPHVRNTRVFHPAISLPPPPPPPPTSDFVPQKNFLTPWLEAKKNNKGADRTRS